MSFNECKEPLRVAILTVSDTRNEDTDKGGKRLIELIEGTEHTFVEKKIVKDEIGPISEAIEGWLAADTVDVIITTGGTGIAMRDVSIEAVSSFFQKEIPGFGEIFRYLSYTEDIGTKAMASRAIAGVANEKLIFTIPGSVGAINLAMGKLILPEMAHLFYEIKK